MTMWVCTVGSFPGTKDFSHQLAPGAPMSEDGHGEVAAKAGAPLAVGMEFESRT
jgi:hypothetical protein